MNSASSVRLLILKASKQSSDQGHRVQRQSAHPE